ncbi:MAG: hypothetical protein AAFY82_10605, partial [Pseudomonadota bacterium]
ESADIQEGTPKRKPNESGRAQSPKALWADTSDSFEPARVLVSYREFQKETSAMRAFVPVSAGLAALAVLAAPTASAECDISQTKCAVNGGKCNIKFRNHTGKLDGSGNGTKLTQTSSAQTVKVRALKENADSAGNALTINAGASNTMNFDNKAKKKFEKVRISSPAMAAVEGATMNCANVVAVLNGNGTCNIFHGVKPERDTDNKGRYQLGYSCDGSSVSGPQ